jgi:nucleotide-binding universal stress UspA family protein
MRTPWHHAFASAAAEVAKHVTLTLAVMTGGAIIATLVLLLVVVAAPIAVALLAWILWRASRDGADGARRAAASARRRARALGLHVVQGAVRR